MKFSYDEKADAAYFQLTEECIIVDSEEIASGVIYDFDENDQVVGIEILNIKRGFILKIEY